MIFIIILVYKIQTFANIRIINSVFFLFTMETELRFKRRRTVKVWCNCLRRKIQRHTMEIQNFWFHLSAIFNKGTRKYKPHFDRALQRCLGVVFRDSVT